jgi:hypothetical protein
MAKPEGKFNPGTLASALLQASSLLIRALYPSAKLAGAKSYAPEGLLRNKLQ